MNIRGIVADEGRGLGAEIIERGEAFARGEGTKKIWVGAPEPDADADAQNETGAVRLYERVGMHVHSCGVAFEKPNE